MVFKFESLNNFIKKRMFLLVTSGLILGIIFPLPRFSFLELGAILLFAHMTFVVSMDSSLKKFWTSLVNVGLMFWILALLHIVMPFLAWILGLIFYPHDDLIRLGFLIGSFVPIGVTSILWTSVAGGNVAISLAGVTLDTLLCPIILPLFLFLVAGKNIELNYFSLFGELIFMVTIPSILGMILNDIKGAKLNSFSKGIGGFSSKIALFLVVYINAGAIAPFLDLNQALVKLLLVILFLTILSYSLGYLGSLVLREHRKENILAMTYTVGMRNTCFGSVLAVTYFPILVAVPVTLMMLYQQPLAALVAYIFKNIKGENNNKERENLDA